MSADRVVIVGGGVVGSSVAWHLFDRGFRGEVAVVERDPSYRRASSFLAMGGVRQQFGSAANIRLAQHSIRFYRHFDARMRTPEHRPRAWFRQRGYLFLADAAGARRYERRYERQRELGARVERLDVGAIRALVPDLHLDDIEFGLFGPEDGYANPREVLAGFRRAAEAAGAVYVTGEVTRVDAAQGRVAGVTLDDGRAIEARAVVNAAGPFAARSRRAPASSSRSRRCGSTSSDARSRAAGRTASPSSSIRAACTGATTTRRPPRMRIASSWRSPISTSLPARTSSPTPIAGRTSFAPRSWPACPRSKRRSWSRPGPASTR